MLKPKNATQLADDNWPQYIIEFPKDHKGRSVDWESVPYELKLAKKKLSRPKPDP